MKKNAKLSYLFIGIFFLLCLIPSLGMLFFGPSPLLANESAPRTPALRDRNGKLNCEVLADTTEYVGTRFALRPHLVSARSFLFEYLLHSSAEEQVTLGTGGELYYSNTLDDYCGVGLDDASLRRIAEHLAEIQAAVESDGGSFLFAVAPNKNSVIPGRMPSRYPADRESANYTRLLPMLEEYGVHTVDLYGLLAGHPDLYYRSDSQIQQTIQQLANRLAIRMFRVWSVQKHRRLGDVWHNQICLFAKVTHRIDIIFIKSGI